LHIRLLQLRLTLITFNGLIAKIMLHPNIEQKFTHLFKILDFNHDGRLEASDFTGLSENILIFRCIESDSDVESLINQRGKEIWDAISEYLQEQGESTNCNLANWLNFLELNVVKASSRVFDILTKKTVRDIFFIYDENRDDVISKREYLCFFVSLRVGIKQADECFRALDLNNDQRISKEELQKAIQEFFKGTELGLPGNLLFGDAGDHKFSTRNTYLSA
jgi:Ca2+-binding EF-hand superfamily protein